MRPYIKKTIETYDKHADRYRDQRNDLAMPDLIDRMVSLMHGRELLEIGSGPGRDAREFTDRECKVTGLDLSSALVEMAKKAVPEAVFIVGDVLEMPFPDEYFDGIWACATLHHLKRKDIPLALKEMYRVLKPQAPAFISVKVGEGEESKSDQEFFGMERFFSYFSKDEFETYLQEAHFEIIDIWVETAEERYKGKHPNLDRTYIGVFIRKSL